MRPQNQTAKATKPPPANQGIALSAEGAKLANPARTIMPKHVFTPWIERKRTNADEWDRPLAWNLAAAASVNGSFAEGGGTADTFRPGVLCPPPSNWLDLDVPIGWLADFLRLIWQTPNLDWMLLTDRPENWKVRIELASLHYETVEDDGVCAMLQSWLFAGRATLGTYAPPRNVWLGTIAEDPPCPERMEILQGIPVIARFTSREAIRGDLAATDFTLVDWVTVADAYRPTQSVFSAR